METIQVKNLTDIVVNGKLSKQMNIGNQNIWNKTFSKIRVFFNYDGLNNTSGNLTFALKKTGDFDIYAYNNSIPEEMINTFKETVGENGTTVYTSDIETTIHRIELQQKSETASISEMTVSGSIQPFDHIDLGNLPDLTKLVFESSIGKAKTFSLNKNKLTEVDQKFTNNDNLELVVVDMDNITSMLATFENCINLNTAKLNHTSKIESMTRVFNGCTNLQKIPNIDTSSLSVMDAMFQNCHSISDSFTIRNTITSYAGAFNGCATAEGASLIINYSDEKFLPLIQNMVKTADGHVTVGTLVS